MPNNQIFIGRNLELKQLKALQEKKSASIVVVRGRRRIGKSRLLMEFGRQHSKTEADKVIDFTGLAPKPGITAQDQRDAFARKLYEHFGLSDIAKDDWSSLFLWLSKQTQNGNFVIIFDEISWMADDDKTFLPKLKNIWDQELSQNPNLILALCGSVSIWIEKNILSSTAFLGRITLEIVLEQLSLLESIELLRSKGFRGSHYELLQILSVTGGIPWYLEQVLPSDHAFSFINRLCFTKNALLTKDFERIFHDLFNKRSEVYRQIIISLSNGSKDYNQLCTELNYRKSGRLSQYLDNLKESGFITRDYTWSIAAKDFGRLSQFRLSDYYCRFYLKFILKNLKKIESGRFEVKSMSAFDSYESMMGLQFENLLLHNRDMLLEIMNIPKEDIVVDNPYFQRQTSSKEGCQIDYLIQTKYQSLYVFEFKFSRSTIPPRVIDDVKKKIQKISSPKSVNFIPVLVYVGELSQHVIESDYFAKLININDYLD